MAGKTFQNLIDILSELNAGRPVVYVAASEDAAGQMLLEVQRRVAPEYRDLLTVIRPGDDRCTTCGHHKSQHLDAPRACATCMRENADGAFHTFVALPHRSEGQP